MNRVALRVAWRFNHSRLSLRESSASFAERKATINNEIARVTNSLPLNGVIGRP